jgi:AAA domain
VFNLEKIFLPNGMEAVKAHYSEFPLDEFNNHPLIQALPTLADKETIIRKLAVSPLFKEEERQIDSAYRIHMVQRLYQLFQPLPIHLQMWNMVHSLIMQGYLARNPFDADYQRHINEIGKEMINRSFDINSRKNFRTTASCGVLIGFSGMGKTTSINRVLSNIHQVIVHNEYKEHHFNAIQLVWIKLEAPANSSLKSLCLQFFQKVDSILGTNNYQKYVSRNDSLDFMVNAIGILANNISLGLLVVDEISHLRVRGSEQFMNFFVNLINSGINILLIGTPGAYEIFGKELRIARRLTGNAEIIYNNMEFNGEFRFLLESMWKYQWTSHYTPLTEDMIHVFYEETQGVSDLIFKLYVYSQEHAILSGKEKLSVELIRKVAKEKFKLMKQMLEAIRSKNPYKIAQYEDIRRIEVEKAPVKNDSSVTKKIEKQVMEQQKVIKEVTNINGVERRNASKGYIEGDIRMLFQKATKNGIHPSEMLLENGLIDQMMYWTEGE